MNVIKNRDPPTKYKVNHITITHTHTKRRCLSSNDYAFNCNLQKFVQLGELKRNDLVQCFNPILSRTECAPVVAVAEDREMYKTQFVRIYLSGGRRVDLTGDHLIFSIIKEKHHLVPASLVKVGDWIRTESGSSKVTDIDQLYEIPISPQTTLSTMIVNNITVSTLTKYDDPISTEYIRLLHDVLTENDIQGQMANLVLTAMIVKIEKMQYPIDFVKLKELAREVVQFFKRG